MTTYETQTQNVLRDDDFIYYKDENGEVKSGGFSMNLLAFKNGLSPLISGGGMNDTEFSQQFKDHIVPSFLHYQLAGNNSSKELEDIQDLLTTYSQENKYIYDDDQDNNGKDDENYGYQQKGGDLYDTLLNLVSVNKLPIKKNHSTSKQTKKQRDKQNKQDKKNQNTKKNRK